MEKIILGLLMLRGMSAYELKRFIHERMDLMCSNSSGSVHTALKKLLEKGEIIYFEEERSKVYAITEQGKKQFLEWLKVPMSHEKAKNIEFSKLFFLGMANEAERKPLITAYLSELEEEYKQLVQIKVAISDGAKEIITKSTENILADQRNVCGIKADMEKEALSEQVTAIYQYQMLTLQYGLDALQFEIEWFKRLLGEEIG